MPSDRPTEGFHIFSTNDAPTFSDGSSARLADPIPNIPESKPIPWHLRGTTNVALIALKRHHGRDFFGRTTKIITKIRRS